MKTIQKTIDQTFTAFVHEKNGEYIWSLYRAGTIIAKGKEELEDRALDAAICASPRWLTWAQKEAETYDEMAESAHYMAAMYGLKGIQWKKDDAKKVALQYEYAARKYREAIEEAKSSRV